MKYMRRTAGYIWTDYKTNTQIAKELKITPVLDKLLEYKRNWIQHVNRMPRKSLPRITKSYSPTLLVAQLVEALRYKPEGRGFYPPWCHWNFSLT